MEFRSEYSFSNIMWRRNSVLDISPSRIVSLKIIGLSEAILQTSHGDTSGCEVSRRLHSLDNLLADGSEVFSTTLCQPFTIVNVLLRIPVRSCVNSGAIVLLARHRSEKFRNLITNHTRDLPVCSSVSETTTLMRAQNNYTDKHIHIAEIL
jgi:hypothetical protein